MTCSSCGAENEARRKFLEAHLARLRAQLAALRGEHDRVESSFRSAIARFRELGVPFYLAVALLEQGERLAGEGRPAEAEPLFAEAHGIFERLQAKPWLERVERANAEHATV